MKRKHIYLAAGAALALTGPVFVAYAFSGAPALNSSSHEAFKTNEREDVVRVDDDDHRGSWRNMLRFGEDEGEEGDDDDGGNGARRAPPAGTVAPPDNGLFNKGSKPQVQVN